MNAAALVTRRTSNGVATITLNSSHNRNALSSRLRHELLDALDQSIADPAARVIVLAHTGPVFCSGMDLSESREGGAGQQGVLEVPRILETIWSSPKPVVASLAGPARAGGVGLVAAADIAVASERATFAFSEVRLGLVPAVISVTVLPRLLPRQVHELFLTGEVFGAGRARDIGLINSVVSPGGLDEEVHRYTTMLREGGPAALAATKAVLHRRRPPAVADEFAEMNALSAEFFAGAEGQEGMLAFSEKRSPAWSAHAAPHARRR